MMQLLSERIKVYRTNSLPLLILTASILPSITSTVIMITECLTFTIALPKLVLIRTTGGGIQRYCRKEVEEKRLDHFPILLKIEEAFRNYSHKRSLGQLVPNYSKFIILYKIMDALNKFQVGHYGLFSSFSDSFGRECLTNTEEQCS